MWVVVIISSSWAQKAIGPFRTEEAARACANGWVRDGSVTQATAIRVDEP